MVYTESLNCVKPQIMQAKFICNILCAVQECFSVHYLRDAART